MCVCLCIRICTYTYAYACMYVRIHICRHLGRSGGSTYVGMHACILAPFLPTHSFTALLMED